MLSLTTSRTFWGSLGHYHSSKITSQLIGNHQRTNIQSIFAYNEWNRNIFVSLVASSLIKMIVIWNQVGDSSDKTNTEKQL